MGRVMGMVFFPLGPAMGSGAGGIWAEMTAFDALAAGSIPNPAEAVGAARRSVDGTEWHARGRPSLERNEHAHRLVVLEGIEVAIERPEGSGTGRVRGHGCGLLDL
jgi:hypothetical protein